MTHRFLLPALALFALASPASAQQTDRRARDEPEIVVEAGGRVGPCDALLFTPDGRFLLAGGDDKVVRVWPHAATGLDTDRAKVQTLRWRAWREQRGGVKAVAVSPDGKTVAVGGYGMKPATVALIDRESGEVLALTWPKVRPGEDSFGAVMAVAFHPDGKRVGFGTADGSLWFWEPKPLAAPDKDGRPSSLPLWAGKHTANARPGEFNFPRLIYFSGANTLVSVAQSGEVLGSNLVAKLGELPSDNSPAKPLFDVDEGQKDQFSVYRAAVMADQKWLAVASAGPQVLLRSTDGKTTVRFALPPDHFPRSIALHPKTGRLAVGVGSALPAAAGKPRFYAEGNDHILLFDNPAAGESKPTQLPHRGPAEALAFHPTEDRLAIAGGDADEVTLLDLAKPEKPLSVVRGAGRRIWSVGLTENGAVLGVRTERDAASPDINRRGAGQWSRFDLPRLTPTADEAEPWVEPLSTADGWTVEPDQRDRFTWYAVLNQDGKIVRHRLAIDRARDQAPTCFAFLPAKGDRPTRVLVGHYYGCSLFELTPEKATLARLFTGHAGEVLSVAVAKDQGWFVTGGADHTVAAWSLADWPSQAGLGGTFALKDGKIEVAAVDTGSPAWEAGLRTGDVLDLLAVGGELVFDRRPGKPARGTTDAALAALKEPQPRIELFFGWVSKGQPERRESLTTVRQRPLWKWFPAFNDRGRLTDWVVWMWSGSYYHTKSAHGDRLVGWHVNHPEPGGRPEFYQLQQFEKLFHRLDVIEKLVGTRDLAAALTEARGENPLPLAFGDYEPAPVRVALPQTTVRGGGLALTVSVKPRGANPDLLPERIELWVNDHRWKVWPANGRRPLEESFEIPAGAFRTGDNQLAVLSFNAAGGRAEAVRSVHNPKDASASNLLGLAVGINDYSGHRKSTTGARAFGDLLSARKDANDLADRLLAYRGPGRFFPDGNVDLRLDAEASRKQLSGSLESIAKQARPDDLLVVFFAGHGDLLGPDLQALGGSDAAGPKGELPRGARGVAAGAGVFVFCCPEYSPTNPAGTSIPAEELFDSLARVNCRKVVLLDACHSGRAAEANLIRRAVPNGHGPFVIAACDQGELSYEHPKLNHGLFTYAILEALGDGFRRADADADGAVSADELYEYVAGRMPTLLREVGKPAGTQHPVCFPRQPPRFAVVKK
jgi:WD40 repeat protein